MKLILFDYNQIDSVGGHVSVCLKVYYMGSYRHVPTFSIHKCDFISFLHGIRVLFLHICANPFVCGFHIHYYDYYKFLSFMKWLDDIGR